MTRPPKPTDYKHGDVHHPTGRIFSGYLWQSNYWYPNLYQSRTKEDAHIEIMYMNALQRARRANNMPFDIDIDYLKSIKTNRCPVFDMALSWGEFGNEHKRSANSPSLDKIKPEYGYIKGNVCIISDLANKIKQDVGYEELYKVADWLHEKMKEVEKNVKPEQLASVPKKSNRAGKDDSQLGFVFTSGTGEDGDDSYHHCGADARQDADHRAQASSGDSLGRGGQEVGTSKTFEGFENPWEHSTTVIGLRPRGRRIPD